ncbi:hypothetical protein PENTCL1PPCAC_12891, partial [Pristionchus entomophagus]
MCAISPSHIDLPVIANMFTPSRLAMSAFALPLHCLAVSTNRCDKKIINHSSSRHPRRSFAKVTLKIPCKERFA